jgi:tetratricopeptide (TPR) repeat protein
MWALLFVLLAEGPSFDAVFRAGLAALNEHKLAEAQLQLEAAAKIQPANPQVWMALAQTYWRAQQPKAAESAATRAESLDPHNPLVLHGLAYFYSETQDFARAAELESRYAKLAPQDQTAVPRAAELYLRAQQTKPAIDLLTKALAGGDRADLHSLLGQAYENGGRPEKAIPELQAAVKLNPYEESYYFDLGREMLQHKNAKDAIEVLEAGKKVFAKSAQLELALGVAYYGARRFSDAADSFLRTIRIAPDVEQAYIFLARMFDQADDKLTETLQAFARFAAAYPDNHMSNFVYGKALALGGELDKAEAMLRKSMALDCKFWESHFELGVLMQRERKFPQAAAEFQRAIELNPKEPTAHFRLSIVYFRLGKTAEGQVEKALHERLSTEQEAATKQKFKGIPKLELHRIETGR